MKASILFFFILVSSVVYAQTDERISTIEFVQILDENRQEAFFYYQNNWKVLREMAVEKNYIHSYELLETASSEDQPYDIILITTYANGVKYERREEQFSKLIEESGQLKLMNEKKPGEFRKNLYVKEGVRHLN